MSFLARLNIKIANRSMGERKNFQKNDSQFKMYWLLVIKLIKKFHSNFLKLSRLAEFD